MGSENKKKHLQLSIRSLVEFLLQTGDLTGITNLSSRSTSLAGIRGHQRIQKSRPEPYAKEVTINYRIETDSLVLDLQGRIDGVYERSETIVIEEIKTTRTDLDQFMSTHNPLHWAQAKVYAAIYAEDLKLDRILTQLTYLHLDSGVIKTDFQEFTADELKLFLLDLIRQFLDWTEKIQNMQTKRNQSIAASDFPYAGYRSGQQQMIEDVAQTINSQTQIIIQAPTGIGKTVATLYPAIHALAKGEIEKIFYLTARTTGRVIAEQTLAEMKVKGLCIKYVTLTAKEKICFNPEKNCAAEECIYACGFYDRVHAARESIFSCDAFNMDTIIELAQKHQICPFEFSLDISLWVDCIICDINYAFDPRVYLKRFFLESTVKSVFLIDEAHNLVDRSREMFSAQIYKSRFLELRRKIKDKNSEIYKVAGKINTCLREWKKELEPEPFHWQNDRPENLLPLLRQLTLTIERRMAASLTPGLRKTLLDYYFEATWFLKVADMYNDKYATCCEISRQDLSVKLFCIDPSDHLGMAMQRANSTVLFSATITPMDYFAQVLGCSQEVNTRILPSPFSQENLCLLVDPAISTLYKRRAFTKEALVRALGSLIAGKTGNYLIFFPSYEYLRMVAPIFEQTYPQCTILIQSSRMSEEDRIKFLENFSSENNRTLVGFVVMGGIFGEGIDLAGDRLSGAAIVGVGLPGISLERELIRNLFSENDMPGFNYAYLYPGMNRVFQAAGRVIRSENDRGAILLIDSRYSWPEYNSLFPDEWQIQPVQSDNQIRQTLENFWSEQ